MLVTEECVPEHQVIGNAESRQPEGHHGVRGVHGVTLQGKLPEAAMPLLRVFCANMGLEQSIISDTLMPKCSRC